MAGTLRWGFCDPSTAMDFLRDLGQTSQCFGKKWLVTLLVLQDAVEIDGTIYMRYKRKLTCRVDAVYVLYKPILQMCFVL